MASTVTSPFVMLSAPVFRKEPFFAVPNLTYTPNTPPEPASPMERSIRAVMAKYGAEDLHGAALLPSYRCLRRRRPQEENQAVAVTHDDNTYKIMLDVREFAEGSLSVRAVDDNELIVEGVVESKQESQPSENCTNKQSSSRKFQQRFMFPGLQVEGVASSVSSDGVLTVTAPRKASNGNAVEFKMPVTAALPAQEVSSNIKTSDTSSQTSSQVNTQGTQSSITKDIQQAETENQTTVDAAKTISQSIFKNNAGEHIVPIEIEGQTTQTSNETQIKTQLNEGSQVFKQADNTQLSNQGIVSNNSVVSAPFSSNTVGQASSLFGNMFRDSLIPIDSRGLFFQDSFFENSRRHFQDAVDKVMKRVEPNFSDADPLNWYSNLRSADRLEDTRAGKIITEETNYKIVLDVRDFEDGSVSVRAAGDSELLVEGKLDKKTEGTSIMRSFRRRFVMPGHIKCEAITSALSADGVLTITAPKKESHFQITEVKSDDSNKFNAILNNSSVFGSETPSCASPSISIPESSMTSPTSELSGPFEPVFSQFTNNGKVSQSVQNTQSNVNSSQTVTETSQNLSEQANLQSRFSDCMSESSKVINNQNERVIPTQVEQQINTNEKIVNIDYIDKNQKDIDSQTKITSSQSKAPQFQLIGSVKDLTDRNIKETVKQRKSSTSSSQTSQTRDIAINYETPSALAFPIVRRGPFYQDSFFNEVHQNFQSAVRQVLDKWVDAPSLLSRNTELESLHNFDRFHNTLSNYSSILDRDSFDDFTCYKSLRSRSVKEENQAATVRENTEDFKVVLDVHGFSEKDLLIRATSHNELVVEGNVEEKLPGSVSSRKFKKQFILPGRVRMEAVYSALSADDVLTITVPKNTALSITDKS